MLRYRYAMVRTLLSTIAVLFACQFAAPPVLAQGNCAFCDIDPQDRHCFRGDGTLKPNKKGCEKFYEQELALTIETDIDFGRLVMIGQGRGSVTIGLDGNSKTVSGDLSDLGGVAMAGHAVIEGSANRVVQIDLPSRVALRDPAGGQAELRDFQTDLPALPKLDANGRLEFSFTGTLYTEDAISIGGNLRGRVPIRAQYD